jgi:hypothetical protein
MKKLLLLFFLLCVFFSCTEKKVGCIDKDALNYDPTAILMKDSSCNLLSIHKWDVSEGEFKPSLFYLDIAKYLPLEYQYYDTTKEIYLSNMRKRIPVSYFIIDQKKIKDFKIDFIFKFPVKQVNKVEGYSGMEYWDDPKDYNIKQVIEFDTISIYPTNSDIQIIKLPSLKNVDLRITYFSGDIVSKKIDINISENYLINPKSFFRYKLSKLYYYTKSIDLEWWQKIENPKPEIKSGLIINLNAVKFESEFLFNDEVPETIETNEIESKYPNPSGIPYTRFHIMRK